MIRKKIFISYTDKDRNKVRILENKIEKFSLFEPNIIADRHESLKPLAEKVIIGIEESDYIIPIVTRNSYMTQWINQEIGYAKARGKEIRPIIENQILSKLKGFIHKQVDLPYSFHFNKNSKYKESYDFSKCCFRLLSDIEQEISTKKNQQETLNIKTEDGKTVTDSKLNLQSSLKNDLLQSASELASRTEAIQKKEEYLKTEQALYDANAEIESMYDEFENLIKESNENRKRKMFEFERERSSDNRIIVYSHGYSLLFRWTTFYVNSLVSSSLLINLFEGYLSLSNIRQVIKELKELYNTEYTFDYSINRKTPVWKQDNSINYFSSSELVQNWLTTLLNIIKSKTPTY